jgi:hypothetical protein
MTAKKMFDKMLQENDECTSTEMMIEFAKFHVTEALKSASQNAETKLIKFTDDYEIDRSSILEAYPLTKIF